jgi:hypothetical protein
MRFDLSKGLAIKNPELIDEWHPTLNGSLTPYNVSYGSQKKVWWICRTCNNSWEAQVRHRVKRFINGKVINGTGCPKCGLKKIAESSRKMMLARYASHGGSKIQCIE